MQREFDASYLSEITVLDRLGVEPYLLLACALQQPAPFPPQPFAATRKVTKHRVVLVHF